MKTMTCPGSVRRFVRYGAIAPASLVGFTFGSMRVAEADPFLDEIVEFTGQVFCVEQKVSALVIGVVKLLIEGQSVDGKTRTQLERR